MPIRPSPQHSIGQAKAVSLDSPSIRLYGYWVDPKKDLRVPVPIFDHGYYPRMDHPDSVVRKNIMKRNITVPSEASLRKNGYDVDRTILISEIVVHPRHEKNLNFFRSEFPVLMRSLAKREGITFILPANDIPSAKIKRKVALNLWRSAFTPLLLKGKQFTSGRMGFFVIPPSRETISRLRQSLHLEGTEELTEYVPGAVKVTSRRRRNYLTRRYDAAQARRQVDRHLDRVADEIVDKLTDDLDAKLTPVISTKLRLPPDARKDVDTILDDPEAGKALLDEYKKSNYNTRKASSNWTKRWLIPRLKAMLRDQGEEIANEMTSIGFRIVVSLATNYVLHALGAKLPIWAKDTIAIHSVPQSFNVRGMTNISVSPKTYTAPRDADEQLFHWALGQAEKRYSYTENYLFRQILEIKKVPGSVTGFKVDIDWPEWKARRRASGAKEEMGRFYTENNLKSFLVKINRTMDEAWKRRKLFGTAYDPGMMF